MYLADLGNYTQSHMSFELSNVLAVGWLDQAHAFPTGEVDPALLATLKLLATTQWAMQMRGFCNCKLCGSERVPLEVRGIRRRLGSAEIWVPHKGDTSRVFAAPDLIVHYIEAHAYLPPEAFLEALASVDPAQWNGELEAERIVDAAYVGR
jgi:hypothetical protein